MQKPHFIQRREFQVSLTKDEIQRIVFEHFKREYPQLEAVKYEDVQFSLYDECGKPTPIVRCNLEITAVIEKDLAEKPSNRCPRKVSVAGSARLKACTLPKGHKGSCDFVYQAIEDVIDNKSFLRS